jgi:cellobiose phosphorylase/cellobionic acid phosphorylase
MYAEVAHCNDGQTWVRDADGTTVLLVSYDQKYHYIRDDLTNEVFCPSGLPAPRSVENRAIEFHREKTVFRSECLDLKVQQRVFVPLHLPVEITTIEVENLTDRTRELSVFSYALFQLTGKDREGNSVSKTNFAEVHHDLGGVVVTNRDESVPTGDFNGFLISLNEIAGANGYRDQFTRADYSVSTPRILWGWNCDGRPGAGPDCAGIVQVRLRVPPGKRARADFVLGRTSGINETAALRRRLHPEVIDEWCECARERETQRADAFKIDVGNPHYNGLFNIFLKKQLYCYLINKSGFRDNLQTDIALAMADYPTARTNFVRALASQFPDGSVPHGFRPLNRKQYSDKPAWILQTLPALIKESGDQSLLQAEIPFFESKDSATAWEHAHRALRFLASDTGKHGLCRQHYADWNDGLNAGPEVGERESVFVSMQLCHGAREMAMLAEWLGEYGIQEEALNIYRQFKDRLNTVAWDGEWYIRTLCEDGYRIGSQHAPYGKIFLNPQSWAVLSGVADEQRARAVMSQIDDKLEDDIGYRICSPPYEAFDPRVGTTSKALPGANENGGCYNHAAGFKAVADCLLGRAEQAWRTFVKVTPGSPENPIRNSGAEPFNYVNSYSSVPQTYGQSGYAWRTGTSGWFCQLMVEYILGARRGFEGLVVDPCLPAAIPEARVFRRFRDTDYHIHIINRKTGGKGPRSIRVNGDRVDGNVLPVMAGENLEVLVEM